MKISLFTLGFAAFIMSCGNNSPLENSSSMSSTSKVSEVGNIYQNIAGSYFDTLPCADCPGLLTELKLFPDTTFELTERRIVPSGGKLKADNYSGVYSFTEDMKKLKLTGGMGSQITRMYEIGNDQLSATDVAVAAQGQMDVSLDLQEKIVDKIGDNFVFHKMKIQKKYPVQVLNHLPGHDIHVNRAFLDMASEAEKAVVLYYAQQFSSGCDGNGCSLQKAMNLNDEQANAILKKWMPSLSLNETYNSEKSKSRGEISMLFFIQTGSRIQVNCNLMTEEKMINSVVDEFELKDTEVILLKKGEFKTRGNGKTS